MRALFDLLGCWMSYVRAVILTPVFIVHTILFSIYVMTCAFIFRNTYFNNWNIKYIWSWPMIFLSGIKLDIRHHPKKPNGGCLFLFNHSSYMDIPVLFYSTPLPFSFGGKIELFSIPIFGHAMKFMGALPIARKDREQVMKTYQEAEKRVANGECFALAPEGGRAKERFLNEFKSGPFIFAQNAKMPIVPVLTAGLLNVMHPKSIFIGVGRWRHKVIVQTLEEIPPEMRSLQDIKVFREELRQKMSQIYSEMNQEILE